MSSLITTNTERLIGVSKLRACQSLISTLTEDNFETSSTVVNNTIGQTDKKLSNHQFDGTNSITIVIVNYSDDTNSTNYVPSVTYSQE